VLSGDEEAEERLKVALQTPDGERPKPVVRNGTVAASVAGTQTR
jgi:hypothetical protein